MKSSIIIVMLTILLAPARITAQSLLERAAKKTQQKLEQKAEQKAEEKVDKETDRQLDKLDKPKPPQDSAVSESKNALERLTHIKTSKEPVKYSDIYRFSQSITMEMNAYNKKEELKYANKMTVYFTPTKTNFGYQMSNVSQEDEQMKGFSWFVIDTQNNTMLMLGESEGTKNGMASSIRASEKTMQEQPDEGKNINFTKTGRTKNILGYTCHEFVGYDDKTKMVYWMTNDINWQSSGFMNSSQKKRGKTQINYPEGMMLEGDIISGNEERIHYLVTEINPKASVTINTGDYQITNLGSITF